MAQPKPLFIPWLKQQIESGRYPGVHWVNTECTEFSVPWKHALRQDTNSDDILIFKAWAQTNGSSNGQIPGDSSVWKRNFRSALRARGFRTVKDNKNDPANPHKVFAWPEEAASPAPAESSPVCNIEIPAGSALYLGEEELFPDGGPQPDLLQYLEELNIVETLPSGTQGSPLEPPVFIGEPVELFVSTALSDTLVPSQEALKTQRFSPAHTADSRAAQFSTHDQYSPPEGAAEQPAPRANPVQFTSNDSGSNQFGTHFMVNIYYRGKRVLNQVVENEDGFCLRFRNHLNLMESSLPVVQLPSIESILDQAQAQSTQSVLDNLGGLEVRREGSMLLGYRWGESRVYWGLDKYEQGSTPRQLSKNQPEPIYCLKDFVTGIMALIQSCGPSPSYSLYFFLGQQWPDPKNKPWEKKLIMVEVILTALEKLKMMAVENGATSLQSSVDLQISLEQMMELC